MKADFMPLPWNLPPRELSIVDVNVTRLFFPRRRNVKTAFEVPARSRTGLPQAP